MGNVGQGKTPIWLELSIDATGNDVRISARGSRGEQIAFRAFGMSNEALGHFAAEMERAATYGKPLTPELLGQAQNIQKAMTDNEIGLLLGRLSEAAHGPLLIRFMIHDAALHAVPWEASCNARQPREYWAVSSDILPIRGILSSLPWQSTAVESAVRVLAIAPTDSGGLANLRQALSERIPSGEVEWLEPLTGENASKRGVLARLRKEPFPHVIHFVGHGRVENGSPALRVADDGDEESWLDVNVFAQEIAANLHGNVRLVVLEACEGARQTGFSSAAEITARAGVEAVVAHLWPVRANVAQICSNQLYRTLVGAEQRAGNIALAVNDARRAILSETDGSAETMSPVLYLRGDDANIFNFEHRKLKPLVIGGIAAAGAGVGAFAYHASSNTSNQVAEVIQPEPHIAPHIPDESSFGSSTSHQTYEPLPEKNPIPKNRSVPGPKSNPPITTHEPPFSQNTPLETPPMNVPRMGPAPKPPPPKPPLPTENPAPKWRRLLGLLTVPIIGGVMIVGYKNCFPPLRDPPPLPLPSGDDEDTSNTPPILSSRPPPAPIPGAPKSPTTKRTHDPSIPQPTTPKDLENGSACSDASSCHSGFCVDGVCCDDACGQTCRACSTNAGGSVNGRCSPIIAGKDPAKECSTGGGCNGKGACALPCSPKAPCPVLIQDATPKENGASCTNGSECKSTHCVDGECCDSACTGLCMACSAAGGARTKGLCAHVAKGADPANECKGVNNVCDGNGACTSAIKP